MVPVAGSSPHNYGEIYKWKAREQRDFPTEIFPFHFYNFKPDGFFMLIVNNPYILTCIQKNLNDRTVFRAKIIIKHAERGQIFAHSIGQG